MLPLDILTALQLRTRRPTPTTAPGPTGKALLGVLRDFASDPLSYLVEMQRRYGDLVRLPIGPDELFVVTHPDDIETILVRDAAHFEKDMVTRALSLTLGQGLLTAEGEHWRRNRKIIAPAFRKKHLEAYGEAMVRAAEDAAAHLHHGQIVDLHHVTMHLTLQIVAETLFGSDVREDAEAIGQTIEMMMNEFVQQVRSWRRLVPMWVPLPGRVKMQRTFKRIDEVIFRIIAERRRQPAEGDDLLSVLLHARDEEGGQLDDQQLRDEAITLFVAGHETTALALTFTLWLLAENPEADARLAAELRDVLGDRRPTPADLPALPYTDAVIKESLRLLPPAWAIGRSPLQDVELQGHRISAGSQLLIPQWVVHHDPRWFAEPDRFRPERWLDGSLAHLPRFAFFPFGGGPRICVGNHFAMMETALVLAVLHPRFRFRARSARRPELVPSVTLRPMHGVRMRVERRES